MPRELKGTSGAANPFFSPDGEWIAFFVKRHLWKMAASGGSPLKICESDTDGTGFWAGDGTIVFSGAIIQGRIWPGLARVRAEGGAPEPLTKVEPERDERFHSLPEILPDGRFVFVKRVAGEAPRQQLHVVLDWFGDLGRRVPVK